MCGRSACHRDRRAIRHACAYRPRGSKKAVKPAWVSCSSQKYYPSYNISPQINTVHFHPSRCARPSFPIYRGSGSETSPYSPTHSPVLLSGSHAHLKKTTEDTPKKNEKDTAKRVIQTMKWGLIPSWHKGDLGSFPTLLNNCRSDGMTEKASFRTAVQKSQRCVVLADGFFEWDRKGSHKQPYFIYFAEHGPTAEMQEVTASGEEEEEEEEEEKGEKKVAEAITMGGGGKSPNVSGRMLTMAGLFDIWRRKPNDEPLFTYTIITVDAHPDFNHIHHRMPAILDGDEAIRTWLDPSVPTHEVVKLLEPSGALKWHPVSTVVNNIRHKSPECIAEINPSKQISSKQNTLLNWFAKSPKKQPQEEHIKEETKDLPQAKKLKLEPEY